MDSKYIEQLLERYWQCETSLEDEAELRAFLSGSDVPKHLLRYKDLFVYQQLSLIHIWQMYWEEMQKSGRWDIAYICDTDPRCV